MMMFGVVLLRASPPDGGLIPRNPPAPPHRPGRERRGRDQVAPYHPISGRGWVAAVPIRRPAVPASDVEAGQAPDVNVRALPLRREGVDDRHRYRPVLARLQPRFGLSVCVPVLIHRNVTG